MMEIAYLVILLGLLVFTAMIGILINDILKVNNKILYRLDVLANLAEVEEEPPNETPAELHKLGVEEDEDELTKELRDKMSIPRGIWEEDNLEPGEIEQL